ncbi:prenyltransferase/squalene oxidase repeat-containing protein [Streptomyces sp. NPDC051320]|uniref:prenyltransferase/squalene oxidase repeat-containing protein n=1 Tax=Streptomyces sp. NPDC051320 TaxID=3154644 RepID=UPI0034131F19
MTLRRSAATALVASAVICGAAAPVAQADDASPSGSAAPSASPSVVIPSGLYGKKDPTFDGVWRQSLALLAQDTVDVRPAAKAVDWLTAQQCANGGFASFRADPAKPCDDKTLLDTNATAAAVQALDALGGHDAAVRKGADWLKSVANKDGGWSYNPGGASDANSTSVVIGALAAAGDPTGDAKKVLVSLSIPCDAGPGAGAFAYQPDKKSAGKSYLQSHMPGAEDQPDFGNTADAVTALGADGLAAQARQPLAWLEQNAAPWAKDGGPAAYAQLIFAAHANNADPRAFGTTDLVKGINATGPAPASLHGSSVQKKDTSGSSITIWWIVAIGLVAGVGVGFLMSMRGRKRQR